MAPWTARTACRRPNFGLFHRTTGFRGPWVGGHYFVIPNLSVGATIGFVSGSSSSTSKTGAMTRTTDGPPTFLFVVAPKVGYALMFTNMLGLWFRAGPGLHTSRTGDANPEDNNDVSNSTTYWFLSADVLFVVDPNAQLRVLRGSPGQLELCRIRLGHQQRRDDVVGCEFRSFSIDTGLFGDFDL